MTKSVDLPCVPLLYFWWSPPLIQLFPVPSTTLCTLDYQYLTYRPPLGQFNPLKPVYSHFTQVVWESTTELGCAISSPCDDIFPDRGPATLVVCLYNPPGNVVGEILYAFSRRGPFENYHSRNHQQAKR